MGYNSEFFRYVLRKPIVVISIENELTIRIDTKTMIDTRSQMLISVPCITQCHILTKKSCRRKLDFFAYHDTKLGSGFCRRCLVSRLSFVHTFASADAHRTCLVF
jgi:hypothetical protein